MAKTAERRVVTTQFKEIVGAKTSLFVAKRSADHPTSMEILKNAAVNGTKVELRPVGVEDILLIQGDRALISDLTNGGSNYTWFWMAGKGIGINQGVDAATLYTLNENLTFTKGKGFTPEETVRVYPGTQPLSLGVYSGDDTADDGGRFVLVADDGSCGVAPVVVGMLAQAQAAREASAPNERAALLLKEIQTGMADTQSKVAELERLLRAT